MFHHKSGLYSASSGRGDKSALESTVIPASLSVGRGDYDAYIGDWAAQDSSDASH